MKKSVLFIFVVLLCLSACAIPYKIPYGIWVSDDPKLMLNITGEPGSYSGIYEADGEEIMTSIFFGHDKVFVIKVPPVSNSIYTDLNSYAFGGKFKIERDTIYYTLVNPWKEETGYDVIVFRRIGDVPEPSAEITP